LAKTYLDIIEVCIDFREMIKAQQKNPLKRVVHSSSMEQKFKDAEARFRAHRKTVEKEAETSHMIEAAEARAIVLRDRKLQEMNNKGKSWATARGTLSRNTLKIDDFLLFLNSY
jgi:gentisate 1,2-dioxygenase